MMQYDVVTIMRTVLVCMVMSFPAPLFSQTETAPIKVGIILALSGDAAAMGRAFKNGFELGLTKLAATTRAQLKIRYEDDALNPRNAVSAYRKLEATEGVDVLVSYFSGSSLALAPIAESNRIPMFAIAADPNVVRDRKYVFNFWMTPDTAVEALFRESLKRGYKNIARVCATHSGAVAYRDSFDRLNGGRLTLEMDEEFSPDTRDFRTFLSKLRTKNSVDALLVILLPGQIGVFTKQARALGFSKDFIGVELFEDRAEVAASDGAMMDQWYVNSELPSDDFQSEYSLKYPDASQYTAPNGYDFALLLGDAIEKGHSRETLNSYFQNLRNFNGAMGQYSASGDQRFTFAAAIKVVRKEGFIRQQ